MRSEERQIIDDETDPDNLKTTKIGIGGEIEYIAAPQLKYSTVTAF